MKASELAPTFQQRFDKIKGRILAEIGTAQIANIHQRVGRGIGVDDHPMRDYTKAYAKRKAASGRHAGMRNLSWSGRMLGSIAFTVSTNVCTISISDATNLIKARAQQHRSPWFGISESDNMMLTKLANQIVKEELT